ncbi:MAG: hypothetical protein QF822_01105 [Candidatus Poseidoniia archaeon]|jgi:hypothetical protein|nr:hypothetical protein [Candidatus Poseidoniia archaeon]MDP6533811.1 hypothetical protein [Candidatus Poseidoniia archaeon]MDP6835000.1 hypothetical protein [Candidatus Poseidoniia archaeon]HIH79495.1 hypothetical protein [Candidatus Poseidoniia archaeon]|tara:strand:- start:323 stop:598 length:276 start_codon:yes stop_codon:yes gene_type:complete
MKADAVGMQQSLSRTFGALGKFMTGKATRDPELAPHAYLIYLLFWTALVGLFVLFIFPHLSQAMGLGLITLLIIAFVLVIIVFHRRNIFAD